MASSAVISSYLECSWFTFEDYSKLVIPVVLNRLLKEPLTCSVSKDAPMSTGIAITVLTLCLCAKFHSLNPQFMGLCLVCFSCLRQINRDSRNHKDYSDSDGSQDCIGWYFWVCK